jgi:hypothetical protein
MKQRIIAQGAERLRTNLKYQTRVKAAQAAIRERYAPLLAQAGFFRRLVLRWQMWQEYRRVHPSAGSLYARKVSAGV